MSVALVINPVVDGGIVGNPSGQVGLNLTRINDNLIRL